MFNVYTYELFKRRIESPAIQWYDILLAYEMVYNMDIGMAVGGMSM